VTVAAEATLLGKDALKPLVNGNAEPDAVSEDAVPPQPFHTVIGGEGGRTYLKSETTAVVLIDLEAWRVGTPLLLEGAYG